MVGYYPLQLIDRDAEELGQEYARISATTTSTPQEIKKALTIIETRLVQLEELKSLIITLGMGKIKEEKI